MGVLRIWCHRSLAGSISLALLICATAACGRSTSTNLVGPSLSKCAVSATNNTPAVPAAGGAGTITVTAQRECAWSAQAQGSGSRSAERPVREPPLSTTPSPPAGRRVGAEPRGGAGSRGVPLYGHAVQRGRRCLGRRCNCQRDLARRMRLARADGCRLGEPCRAWRGRRERSGSSRRRAEHGRTASRYGDDCRRNRAAAPGRSGCCGASNRHRHRHRPVHALMPSNPPTTIRAAAQMMYGSA